MNQSSKVLLVLLAIASLVVTLVVSAGSASAATTNVAVGDIYFCNESLQGGVCTTTITAGDTVVWDFSGAELAHTVTECGASCSDPTGSPSFDSGVVQSGEGTFQYTFTTAGTYNYYCQIHAFDQQGKIVVQASAATPTLVSGATPVASGTPASGGLPPTGYGANASDSTDWRAFAVLAMLAVALLLSAALAYACRDRAS